jgi:hypothetical protein
VYSEGWWQQLILLRCILSARFTCCSVWLMSGDVPSNILLTGGSECIPCLMKLTGSVGRSLELSSVCEVVVV